MENAALAVHALEELDQGRTITAEHIVKGLAKSFWPGRMEELLQDVFVDGAHNEDGVRAFLESVAADNWQGERILLFSAVKDKQFDKMLGEILKSRLFGKIFLVPIKTNRATKVEVLEDIVQEVLSKEYQVKEKKPEHGIYGDVKSAMKDLLAKKQEQQRIYVAGSLYLVGEVKANLGVLKDD
jgi:dihydrofolate synthase/folylpolyglutamate synthase